MALMNKKLSPDCETLCLMASQNYQFLSSSVLKEVASMGGSINDLAPKPVLEALKKRYNIKD
jgi:pantetheine-phosphate adenylyltransferase